jgi:cysteine-rich repeat protein
MVPCSRGARVELAAVVVALVCALPAARALAAGCDQSPTGNTTLLGCAPAASACVVLNWTLPAGCELDYQGRKVTFRGVVDVGAAALVVRAGTIVVEGQLLARSDGTRPGGRLELTATTGDITVGGKLDVSGDPAGLITLAAEQGSVAIQDTLTANGKDDVVPNGAGGGTIQIGAHAAITQGAELRAVGGADAGGGTVRLQAGTSVTSAAKITATGGNGDGGDVAVLAGDGIALQRAIDVSSTSGGGGGGSITARAGMDALGGASTGGALAVSGDLVGKGSSDGSGEDATGGDGGDVTLTALGSITLSGGVDLSGDNPDGGGGRLIVAGGDGDDARLTPLDGDVTLSGAVVTRGGSDGDGGESVLDAGRDLTIGGPGLDQTGGSAGGDVTAVAGRNLRVQAIVDVSARSREGDAGSVDVRAGLADVGTLTVTVRMKAAGATDGGGGNLTLAGCHLVTGSGITLDARATGAASGGQIDLAATRSLTLGANGTYTATPGGLIELVHPSALTPVIGTGVSFNPGQTNVVIETSGLFPLCPECGDGIRQPGEACDKGAGADGTCCNATCSAFLCPTPTATPTLTPTATSLTPTATASAGGTSGAATPTSSRTGTPAGSAGGPTPSAAGSLGPTPTVTPLAAAQPKPIIRCERTLSRASVGLVLTDLRMLEACSLAAFKCIQSRPAGGDRDACLARATMRCAAKRRRIERARTDFAQDFADDCGDVAIGELRAGSLLAFERLEPRCEEDVGLALTSPEAVAACVQLGGACAVEDALAVGVPRAADLLGTVLDLEALGLCVPAPTGNVDGLPPASAAAARRCQNAVARAAERTLASQLRAARGCVDALFRCRLSERPAAACTTIGRQCEKKLAGLARVRGSALAKMVRTCAATDDGALLDQAGLGFAALAARCPALGATPPQARDAFACVLDAFGCAGVAVLRYALPMIDSELAEVGLALDDGACASATPLPTPLGAPTTTASPTAEATAPAGTPTPAAPTPAPTETAPATPSAPATGTPAAATPTFAVGPTPTPGAGPACGNGILEPGEQCDFGDREAEDGCDAACAFELLVAGGGAAATDCIAEWAVINPAGTPAPGTPPDETQRCTDGDPRCDADDVVNGECRMRVAVCFDVPDAGLAGCPGSSGITRYVLQSPRPTSRNATDAANAIALLGSFARLTSVAPAGRDANTLDFMPPLAVVAPDDCTAVAELVVPLGGQASHTERFRVRVTALVAAGGGGTVDERDSLRLVCERPSP